MFWNILADEAAADTAQNNPLNQYLFPILIVVLVILLVVWFIFSGRKNKQRQKEYTEQLEAIKPGHKIKSVGGICGIVVEVCDDNTVVIETGTEASGKSYFKLDKECIAQTDAKGPAQIAREAEEERKKAEKKNKKAPAEKPEKPEEKSEEKPEEKPGEKSEETKEN